MKRRIECDSLRSDCPISVYHKLSSVDCHSLIQKPFELNSGNGFVFYDRVAERDSLCWQRF
jgi:hypothetical protein